jgi:hypothetical protein
VALLFTVLFVPYCLFIPFSFAATTITTVDSQEDIIFQSLVLKNNDNPVINYLVEISNELKLIICGNATC